MSEKVLCPYCFWYEPAHHASCPSAEIASLCTQLQEAQEKLNRAYIEEVYQDNEIRELAESLETAMEILKVCEIDLKIRLNSLKAFGGGSAVERIEGTLSRIHNYLHDGTKGEKL